MNSYIFRKWQLHGLWRIQAVCSKVLRPVSNKDVAPAPCPGLRCCSQPWASLPCHHHACIASTFATITPLCKAWRIIPRSGNWCKLLPDLDVPVHCLRLLLNTVHTSLCFVTARQSLHCSCYKKYTQTSSAKFEKEGEVSEMRKGSPTLTYFPPHLLLFHGLQQNTSS